MEQKIFAEKKIKCSESTWSLVLSGKRNLSYRLAKKASKFLGTEIDIWINPNTPVKKRREAWENFNK